MESHVRTLAQAQARLGAEVQVLCVNHRDAGGRDVTWETFAATGTVEEWDGPVHVTRCGRRATLARLDVCPRLPEWLCRLRRRGVDVVHLHVPNPTMLLALAAVGASLPLVVTYHSDVVKQRRLGRLLRPFEHLVFRRAAAILTTSPLYAAGSEMLQHYTGKLRVLPFGVDLECHLNPTAESRGYACSLLEACGRPLWLAVGRLVYYKGLHNAVRALPSVPGKLLVVGDGPLKAELQDLAWQLGVADRILWRPRLSDAQLAGAYQAATALWFPSNARSEAFGIVQIEAMASGCPVINTALPASGVAWVSRHEDSGLTVPVDDADALSGAARRLLEQEGLRERLSEGGRRRATEEFGQERMAQRSLELYAQALGPKERHEPRPPGNGSIRFLTVAARRKLSCRQEAGHAEP
jgi:rhamnosyl/mannosyltransferase